MALMLTNLSGGVFSLYYVLFNNDVIHVYTSGTLITPLLYSWNTADIDML